AISNIQYLDGDQDGGNDWSSLIENGELTWTAPNTDSSLEWGHMATFVFEANEPPSPGPVELYAEELSLNYSPVVLGPNPGLDFTEGFESL
ncbi:MAG TPA: hypothetical protein VJ984_08295, partial [Xanthomonadales bacterium]|nr:hypothetical protein [Xanthomonadales bacterium]